MNINEFVSTYINKILMNINETNVMNINDTMKLIIRIVMN